MAVGDGGRQPYARSVQQESLEYDEFRQPDVNGDNVISKPEVRTCFLASIESESDTIGRDFYGRFMVDFDSILLVGGCDWSIFMVDSCDSILF